MLAIVHSVLASKQAKDLVRNLAGPRWRNGLYRFGFIVQSLITVGWTTIWFLRLPDRQIYHVRSPWSWLLRLGQGASVVLLLSGVRVIGIMKFLGLPNLYSFLTGATPDQIGRVSCRERV